MILAAITAVPIFAATGRVQVAILACPVGAVLVLVAVTHRLSEVVHRWPMSEGAGPDFTRKAGDTTAAGWNKDE